MIKNTLLLIVSILIAGCGQEKKTSLITDRGLEKAVRIALGKKSGEITVQDLASITEIHSTNCNTIASLEGIEKMVNLEVAAFPCNKIIDITPLNSLSKVRVLDLNSNKQLSDISKLSNLRNLEELFLSENSISDVAPLGNLKKLRKLWIDRNDVVDISMLEGLESLEVLIAYWNEIEKLPDFRKFKKLTKVDLHNNKISDSSELETLKKIVYVNLQANSIHNPNLFIPIGKAEFINLSQNPIDCSKISTTHDSLIAVGVMQIDCK